MRDYLVKGQQKANLREGKVLWRTWQVDYVRPMTHNSEGWKCIMTEVETGSGLGNVYPTRTAPGWSTAAGLNRWLAVHPIHLPCQPQSNGIVERWNWFLK